MPQPSNNIRVKRIDLLEQEMDEALIFTFEKLSEVHHEFGIDWLRNLAANTLQSGERAYIYLAGISASDFVALPLIVNTTTREIRSLSNYYSSIYTPLAHSANSQDLYVAIFRYLLKSENTVSISLSPMDAQLDVFSELQSALQASGWKGVHTWPCFANWIHPAPGANYREYFDSLPSKLKNTIKRKSRKFTEADNGRLRIVQDEVELSAAIEEFGVVYERSWKQQEPHPNFIPGLLQLATEKHWLRLGLAYYDDIPVAAQIWLVSNNTAHIFKLAYDEAYKKLSPGTVLTAYLMEYVIDHDHVSTIDYLTGDDSYKRDWMSVRRERCGVAAYNPSSLAGLRDYAAHQLKTLAKTFLGKTSSK